MPAKPFDVHSIRNDFPTLSQMVHEQPLVYLDTAASSQKPHSVLQATAHFYRDNNANVHRGKHSLSERATEQYEQARVKVAQYFNVSAKEIVWTKGATEAINLVAHGLAKQLSSSDSIVISPIEHHANIVPWQVVCENTGAQLKVLPLNQDGTFDIPACCQFIAQHQPSVLAISHASNALGNVTELVPLITAAKAVGAIVLVDGAQAAMHLKPDLSQLNCDFYVCSAHKMLGPTGVGVLYGRYNQLNALTPYQTGGEMIETVTLTHSTFRDAPAKFEAGTPNIAGVIGFAAAIDYLTGLDQQQILVYEQALFEYAAKKLVNIDGITIYSNLSDNIGTLCFNYKDEHPYDLSILLDSFGVAVRGGHHCTQPLMAHLGINGSVRASFCFYNSYQDVDIFINSLLQCIDLLD